MPQSVETLHKIAALINFSGKLNIVDIGANPIGGPPPYASLIAANLANLIGFEPQKEAYEALIKADTPNEKYLPYAVGDGKKHKLNIYKGSGLTSLFRIRRNTIDAIRGLRASSRLVAEETIDTKKLDSLKEVQSIDFLKIDIQGGELAVFENGTKKLKDALAIQTEVAFSPLYEDQPMFGDVDVFLRSIGFMFHRFAHVAHFPLGRLLFKGKWRKPMHHTLDGDVVYTRDFSDPAAMSDIALTKLALLAHACFQSYDLAALCISNLEARGTLAKGAVQSYADILPDEYTLG
ncbi:MAG: FkbM family methyltransferase [Paracoccaceae bacterium]